MKPDCFCSSCGNRDFDIVSLRQGRLKVFDVYGWLWAGKGCYSFTP